MTGRRQALLLLPLLAAACGGRGAPPPAAPRLDGYAWLTPLLLNVAEVEVVSEPASGGSSLRADLPAPLVPAQEVARMGRDRLTAVGSTGHARFVVETAILTRERQGGAGLFTEPTERLTCVLRCRVEVLGNDGRRTAFAEAETRRTATVIEGGTATRARSAEDVVAQAMQDLNVEFELQVRRNLRDWLLDSSPVSPAIDTPGGIQREDLPHS